VGTGECGAVARYGIIFQERTENEVTVKDRGFESERMFFLYFSH